METLEQRLEAHHASCKSLRLRDGISPTRIWTIPREWEGCESKFDFQRDMYVILDRDLEASGFIPNCTALFWRIDKSPSVMAKLSLNTVERIPASAEVDVIESFSYPIGSFDLQGIGYESVVDAGRMGLIRTVTDVEIVVDRSSAQHSLVIQRTSSRPATPGFEMPSPARISDWNTLLEF